MTFSRFARVRALALLIFAASCRVTTTPLAPNPPPSLYSIQPQSVLAGSAAFTLTARGADFTSASRVRWNGADRPTTFVSDSLLRASITAASVAAAGSDAVSVYTGAPGGGTSGELQFIVAPPPPLTWTVTAVAVANGTWDATISSNGIAYATHLSTNSISRISLTTNRLLGSFQVGTWPYEVVFNATGSLAYVTNLTDQTVGVVNTATSTQIATYPVPAEPIRVRVGPGGSKLYVTQIDGNVVILNASNGTAANPPVFIGGILNGVALTPDSSRLWVSNTSGKLAEINTSTDAVARSIPMGGRPQDMAISADGATLYVANEDGWVGVYNLANLARLDSIPVSAAFGLALNPAGSQLWVSRSQVGLVAVFHTASRTYAGTVTAGGAPRHIAFASDGTALIANESGVVQIARQNP
jgi:YVTN family beta-propeller protein